MNRIAPRGWAPSSQLRRSFFSVLPVVAAAPVEAATRSRSPGGTTPRPTPCRVSGTTWQPNSKRTTRASPSRSTGYQNEDLQRTLIPNALQSGDAPDLFMVWPGGEVRAQAEAGYLMDLTDVASDTIADVRWRRQAVGGRRQAVRPALLVRRHGHLVQQGPVRAGRHRGHARDASGARRRRMRR